MHGAGRRLYGGHLNDVKSSFAGGGDSVGRAVAEMLLRRGELVHIRDVLEKALEGTLVANPGMRGTMANVGRPADGDAIGAS